MDLSIIVVAYNVKDLVRECFTKITLSKDKLQKEIIYVDNGSTDGTMDMLKTDFPNVLSIASMVNLGFTRANNLAYGKATGTYVLMLNSDAFIGENVLQRITDYMSAHPDCGILGCRLTGRDGTLQPSARIFPTPLKLLFSHFSMGDRFPHNAFLKGVDDLGREHSSVRETDWVPGCFLLVRKAVIAELGFFLRKDLFIYYDDVDLCLRAKRKGWKVVFYPEDVVHLGGENSRRISNISTSWKEIEDIRLESEFLYFRKNYGIIHVLGDILVLLFIDIVSLIRCYKKNLIPAEIFDHMRLICRKAISTKLGMVAIR